MNDSKRFRELVNAWCKGTITYSQLRRAEQYHWTVKEIVKWDKLTWFQKVKYFFGFPV